MFRVLRAMLIIAPLMMAISGCSESRPEPVAPSDPGVQQMCIWLVNLRNSSVLQQEVSGEHLESIGVAAETLATEASQIQLRGEAQTSLAFAGAILQNIKEASRDERGLETIPTYKSILGEQIGQLLEAVSATYELPPNQAVCAAYDG